MDGASVVDEVVAALMAGGVVVLPTDTVYGLVALPGDAAATAQLFALKGRADDVPLAVLCASADQALGLAEPDVGPAVSEVAARWWPGPLTLVLTRRRGVDLHLGEPATTVGVRVPDHELVRAIARRVGPLAATSANRHGAPVVSTAAEAAAGFGADVAYVVDGGRLEAQSSTVIDATVSPWVVRRKGPVDAAQVLATARSAGG